MAVATVHPIASPAVPPPPTIKDMRPTFLRHRVIPIHAAAAEPTGDLLRSIPSSSSSNNIPGEDTKQPEVALPHPGVLPHHFRTDALRQCITNNNSTIIISSNSCNIIPNSSTFRGVDRRP